MQRAYAIRKEASGGGIVKIFENFFELCALPNRFSKFDREYAFRAYFDLGPKV